MVPLRSTKPCQACARRGHLSSLGHRLLSTLAHEDTWQGTRSTTWLWHIRAGSCLSFPIREPLLLFVLISGLGGLQQMI